MDTGRTLCSGKLLVPDTLPDSRSKVERALYEQIQHMCKPRKDLALKNELELEEVNEESVFFNSMFESGNLRQVFRKKVRNQYDLYLDYDTNNESNLTQWLYFSVSNVKAGVTVRLNICNLAKEESLYNQGMKPCAFSVRKKDATGVAWHRAGFDISYFRNSKTIKASSVPFDHEFDQNYLDLKGE